MKKRFASQLDGLDVDGMIENVIKEDPEHVS